MCLRSVSDQSQISLTLVLGQSQVSLRSVSSQSQVSLRSLSGLSVPTSSVRTEPKILRLVFLAQGDTCACWHNKMALSSIPLIFDE